MDESKAVEKVNWKGQLRVDEKDDCWVVDLVGHWVAELVSEKAGAKVLQPAALLGGCQELMMVLLTVELTVLLKDTLKVIWKVEL